MYHRRKWTKEEEEILVQMYTDKNTFCADIAEKLGRTMHQVYSHAQVLGLKAPIERIRLAGQRGAKATASIAHRFQKGAVPVNKGKKLSPEQYAKVSKTFFKKGHVSQNKRPVGSERVNVDGYVEIKVKDPNKWRLKHRVVWEEHNGKIPCNCNIQFKNKNRLDCRIENLYMISKEEQMRKENSIYARYPEELREVIKLKARVKSQITKLTSKNEE